MHQLSIACFWFLIAITAYNGVWTLYTLIALRRLSAKPALPDHELPKTAVLLSLRGADPSLPSCLRRLLNQNYPNYDLFIAVDSKSDPAWDVVQEAIRESDARNVHVSILRNRLTTCSLKCSALVQLVDRLDDSYQAIALADADLESHATWLRELVAPLADPKVGAAYGNRWFVPNEGRFGSLIRQLWNGPGLVVMHILRIPWAGSLAIRADVFKRSRLRDRWAQSIVDDGPVRIAVKAQNMRLEFVPSLIMANREDCSVDYAFNFLRRQMTWTRTYLYGWWMVLFGSVLFILGVAAASAVFAATSYFFGATETALNFAAGLAVLAAGSSAMWFGLDGAARRAIRAQNEAVPSPYTWRQLLLPVAMFAACWMHVVAGMIATFRRRVSWRGVVYEIRGPSNIHIVSSKAMDMPRVSTSVSI